VNFIFISKTASAGSTADGNAGLRKRLPVAVVFRGIGTLPNERFWKWASLFHCSPILSTHGDNVGGSYVLTVPCSCKQLSPSQKGQRISALPLCLIFCF